MIHTLSLEQRNLHGHFSRDLAPILTIAPGDSVRFSIPNSGWLVESGEKFAPRDPAIDTGHALVGPIALRGAKPGQTLAVRVDEVRPGSWAITKTKTPHFTRWAIDGDTATSLGRRVRLAPFLGGMPPPEPGIHSTIPPRRFGGNIDCKDLTAGTTLYLPIAVDGALFSAGDGHAAQGDGEVAGTAIESPVEAQVTLSVRDDMPLDWPIARVGNAWFTFGCGQERAVLSRTRPLPLLAPGALGQGARVPDAHPPTAGCAHGRRREPRWVPPTPQRVAPPAGVRAGEAALT